MLIPHETRPLLLSICAAFVYSLRRDCAQYHLCVACVNYTHYRVSYALAVSDHKKYQSNLVYTNFCNCLLCPPIRMTHPLLSLRRLTVVPCSSCHGLTCSPAWASSSARRSSCTDKSGCYKPGCPTLRYCADEQLRS